MNARIVLLAVLGAASVAGPPAPSAVAKASTATHRCPADLRPGGVRELRVRRVACDHGALLITNWSRANKHGRTTRVGSFTCVARGPANAGAIGVRCRTRTGELVSATFLDRD